MAKKSKKSKKPSNPGDGIRDAVERTFQGAAGGASGAQKRVQEVFDDFGNALVSLREAIDERRVLDTIDSLREEVLTLTKRVQALEGSPQERLAGAGSAASTAARNHRGEDRGEGGREERGQAQREAERFLAGGRWRATSHRTSSARSSTRRSR
jgi:hypothetical protein